MTTLATLTKFFGVDKAFSAAGDDPLSDDPLSHEDFHRHAEELRQEILAAVLRDRRVVSQLSLRAKVVTYQWPPND